MAESRRDDAILLCHGAEGAHWQFGRLPPRQGAFVLIGWSMCDGEGGVPIPIVNTLARALAGYGRVTFPCSAVSANRDSGWLAHGADYVGAFPLRAVSGWRGMLAALRDPSDLILLSTLREEAVCGLFDDAAYPWWLQGQFALLSRPATTPPNIAAYCGLLQRLFEPEWADAFSELRGTDIEAILRPGVDGDVAGLLCTSPEICREVEESICRAASDFGLACRILSEDAFQASLATETNAAR